jgi:restriction system protein
MTNDMAKKLRTSGGYRATASFQTTTIIYDATYWFCEKFIEPHSRMADQMIQAARSGRQNIAEGSRASATSSQTELRLLNVARASLEELLLDFEDYLRQRRLVQWLPKSKEALAVRDVPKRFKDQSDQSNLTDLTDQQRWTLYAEWLEHANPAMRANALICLINQANFLLDQQIVAVEKQFTEQGGYSEQLAAARLAEREKKRDRMGRSDPVDQIPSCPKCAAAMVLRTVRSGKNTGKQFWGCSAYPDCKGIVEL